MPKRKSQKQTEPPEFFLDRSLGRYDVASELRRIGLTVHPMFEVYPDDEQDVQDVEWLRKCAERGWVALHKNPEIHKNKFEKAVLLDGGVRSFVITRGGLSGPEMAARYVTNMNRIIQHSRKPGPFAYGVYPNAVTKLDLGG